MTKYIFDFDDVLFYNTALFKKHMYLCLEEIGIPYPRALKYYKQVRSKFSLKKFITGLLLQEKISGINKKVLYEKIISQNKNFTNEDLVDVVKKLGKKNCYMVTHGEKDYQPDKIKRTGIAPLFSKIFIVQKSKKRVIEKICIKHKNEQVFFIDDKEDRLTDVDLKKCPNLKTVLYTGQKIDFDKI